MWRIPFALHPATWRGTGRASSQRVSRGSYRSPPTTRKKGARTSQPVLLFLLARLGGFEPPTYGLEVRCSIPLSYRRLSETKNYSCTFHTLLENS